MLIGSDAEMRQQDEDQQQRAQTNDRAKSQHLHAAAGIRGGGGAQLVEDREHIDEDANEVERVDDAIEPDAGARAPGAHTPAAA